MNNKQWLLIGKRLTNINWWYVGIIFFTTNLITVIDGDFFNIKLNVGLLLMILMSIFIYKNNT